MPVSEIYEIAKTYIAAESEAEAVKHRKLSRVKARRNAGALVATAMFGGGALISRKHPRLGADIMKGLFPPWIFGLFAWSEHSRESKFNDFTKAVHNSFPLNDPLIYRPCNYGISVKDDNYTLSRTIKSDERKLIVKQIATTNDQGQMIRRESIVKNFYGEGSSVTYAVEDIFSGNKVETTASIQEGDSEARGIPPEDLAPMTRLIEEMAF